MEQRQKFEQRVRVFPAPPPAPLHIRQEIIRRIIQQREIEEESEELEDYQSGQESAEELRQFNDYGQRSEEDDSSQIRALNHVFGANATVVDSSNTTVSGNGHYDNRVEKENSVREPTKEQEQVRLKQNGINVACLKDVEYGSGENIDIEDEASEMGLPAENNLSSTPQRNLKENPLNQQNEPLPDGLLDTNKNLDEDRLEEKIAILANEEQGIIANIKQLKTQKHDLFQRLKEQLERQKKEEERAARQAELESSHGSSTKNDNVPDNVRNLETANASTSNSNLIQSSIIQSKESVDYSIKKPPSSIITRHVEENDPYRNSDSATAFHHQIPFPIKRPGEQPTSPNKRPRHLNGSSGLNMYETLNSHGGVNVGSGGMYGVGQMSNSGMAGGMNRGRDEYTYFYNRDHRHPQPHRSYLDRPQSSGYPPPRGIPPSRRNSSHLAPRLSSAWPDRPRGRY